MTRRVARVPPWWFLATWVVAVCCHATLYVSSALNYQGIEGYEREWGWQLFFFALVRLPVWLVALVLGAMVSARVRQHP